MRSKENLKCQDDTIIKVESVSKKFSRNLKKSMIYGLEDIARNSLGMRTRSATLRDTEFWALDNVSFEINKGETLGIIGPNGSGKTTLLSLLHGIFWPDKGRITINGHVGILISVGAGFHPMLTGRENIYLNAAILGMSKQKIEEKFNDIVKFADIGDFLDTPVKNYSSGMFVRLGFSVAVYSEPDILLTDEILSVGDIKFQNKCYERIEKLRNKCTIVFVSHNLAAVSRLCDKTLWLDKGRIRMYGPTQEVVREYSVISMRESIQESNISDPNKTILGDIYIKKVELCDGDGNPKEVFHYGDDMVLRFYYDAKKDLGKPFFLVKVCSPKTGVIFGACMISNGKQRERIHQGKGILECRLKKIPLEYGIYYINLSIIPELMMGKLFRQNAIATFEVCEVKKKTENALPDYVGGIVRVPYKFRYIKE